MEASQPLVAYLAGVDRRACASERENAESSERERLTFQDNTQAIVLILWARHRAEIGPETTLKWM